MSKHPSFTHGTTVMGERGQIVIPQNIRTELELEPGAEMMVFAHEGKIIAVPGRELQTMFAELLRGAKPRTAARAKKKTAKRTVKRRASSAKNSPKNRRR